jgi:hypothetical protein
MGILKNSFSPFPATKTDELSSDHAMLDTPLERISDDAGGHATAGKVENTRHPSTVQIASPRLEYPTAMHLPPSENEILRGAPISELE